MLHLGTLDAGIDRLGLCALKLGLGLEDVRPGGDTAPVTVPGQLQALAEGGSRHVEQFFLGVEGAELEIVLNQLGLKG